MRDVRLKIFRDAVDGVIESLEATIRLAQWVDGEPKPEPLVLAASQLVSRLGVADRLAASKFMGPPADVVKVEAISAVMKKLDAAYLVYRKSIGSTDKGSADLGNAVQSLEIEIAAVTAGAEAWR